MVVCCCVSKVGCCSVATVAVAGGCSFERTMDGVLVGLVFALMARLSVVWAALVVPTYSSVPAAWVPRAS